MSAADFEDHPTDPNKVILRKKPHLDKGADYEHGFIDGMQYQMQSSVDKAVNAMSKREKQEPVAWNSGVPPLYPEIKDGETISVEYLETTPQPQQKKKESVAWDVFNKHGRIYFAIGNQSFPVGYTPEDEPDCSAGQAAEWYMDQLRHALTRLVTPQPQREWVGLTDEEIVAINDQHYNIAYRDFDADVAIARAIEAKFKDKNT
jgi:hypothetical protein